MSEKTANTPPRHSPNPMRVSKDDFFSLRIPSGRVALLLTRWLLTKFYRSGRRYSDEEKATCYLIGEYWNSYRNKGFFLKRELEILNLRLLLGLSLKSGKLERHEEKQEDLVLQQKVLFNPRAFLSLPREFARGFLLRVNLRLRKPHPELRRIGVGYRDKGTARFTDKDGSPRWEDVAVSPENRVRRLEPKRWWEVTEFLIPESSRPDWLSS